MKTLPDTESRRLFRLVALIFLAVALSALWVPAEKNVSSPEPGLRFPARDRSDGGQALTLSGIGPPNPLTELNLGRLLDFQRTEAEYLAALPSLGERSAEKAKRRGSLTPRERKNLTGLVHDQ